MSNMDAEQLRQTVSSLMESGRWQETIAMLQEHSNVVHQHWDLCWNLGWAFFKLKEIDEAISHLSQAVLLNPDTPKSHWALATALAEKRDFERAEAEFLTSLSLKDSYLARLGLAILYQQQGLWEKAEHVHLEGIRLKQSSRERHEAYGDFLSDIGKKSEAEEQYAKAAQSPQQQAMQDDDLS